MPENPQSSQQSQMPPYPPYYQPRRRRSNWWIPLLVIGIVIVLIIVFFFAFIGMITATFEPEEINVKNNSVLHVTYAGGVQEYAKGNPFMIFSEVRQASFIDMLSAIERAKYDDNIKGIFYEAKIGNVGYAKADELIKKLDDFKESGKFVYAYIDYGSEMNYMLALPADKIYMPREGVLELNGYAVTSLFFKGLMDKIGVDFLNIHFEDYKSAGEPLSRKSFSDSARKQLREMMSTRFDALVGHIAKYRKMDREKVIAALEKGIYTPDSLLKQGFIDEIATRNDVKEMMKELTQFEDDKDKDKDLRLISMDKYVSSNPPTYRESAPKDKQIAIINGVGVIQQDAADDAFVVNEDYKITPKEFLKYLEKAREDDDVKAIILRIDSPGGSVLASDEIWSAILETKKVKPVYASMSDVAASGGYYIAMACDTIIAHPQTVTGSIGVVLTVPNFAGLMDKIGVTPDTINTTEASQFLNGLYPYEQKDVARLRGIAQDIYYRFIEKAADSRGMNFDEMHQLAKGRVWMGARAKEIGLVDTLLGLDQTIDLVKRRIGVPDSLDVWVQRYPRPVDNFIKFMKMFGLDENEDTGIDLGAIARMYGMSKSEMYLTWNSLPEEMRAQVKYFLELAEISRRERAMIALPYFFSEN
ncbi:MAG: signal peptide peptidase SppA [Candidatus Kapaibacterium sp.]